jgi:MFS family permease
MVDRGGAAAAPVGGIRAISRYQWLVFFVVWAGWTLDAADFGLYSLVLRPALTDLLGGNPSIAEIGKVGGLLSMTGLLGWAFGGFLFGIIADYIGRVRTLAFSILIYSVFTALQGVSYGVWEPKTRGCPASRDGGADSGGWLRLFASGVAKGEGSWVAPTMSSIPMVTYWSRSRCGTTISTPRFATVRPSS